MRVWNFYKQGGGPLYNKAHPQPLEKLYFRSMRKWQVCLFLISFSIFKAVSQNENDLLAGYLRLARMYSFNDSLRMKEVGRKAFEIARVTGNDSAMAELNLYLGNFCYYSRQLNRAENFFKSALAYANLSGNQHWIILSKIRLVFMDYELERSDETEAELNKLYMIAAENGDYRNMAEVLNLIGIIKEETNKANEAAKCYLEGLHLAEQHKIPYYKGVFLNNLGLLKMDAGQRREASSDFLQALEAAEKDNNERLAQHLRINLALTFINQPGGRKSDSLLRLVSAYSRKNNLPVELASAYANIANAFLRAENYKNAEIYYDSSLAILEQHKIWKNYLKAAYGKVDLYINTGKLYDAEQLLKKVDPLLSSHASFEDKSFSHLLSYQLEQARKNPAMALKHYITYVAYRDSAREQINSKALGELKMGLDLKRKEFELEKERSQRLLLEKEKEEERFIKWLTALVILVIGVLTVLFLYLRYSREMRLRQEQFSRQLIESIEEERNRISKDLHDDVGQSLSMIRSGIVKSKQNPDDSFGVLEKEISRVIEQTRQISHGLYPSFLEKIGLKRSVASLLEKVQQNTTIECNFEIEDCVEQLDIAKKTHVYRIIQECVSNTVSHSGATALKLVLFCLNEKYQLVYQDNGKGLEDKKERGGMGLFSIEERAKILNGQMELDEKHAKGFRLIVKF